MKRMHKSAAAKVRRISMTAAAAVVLAVGVPISAGASEPAPAPAPVVSQEDGSFVQQQEATVMTDAGAKAICQAYGKVDYAHVSTSSGNLAVQSHGGWINGNCSATHAAVTVGVMKKNVVGIFVDVGTLGKKTLPSGAWGSGNWAVAHYDCKSNAKHTFQSWVDVDMIGISDWINKTFSLPTDLGCN